MKELYRLNHCILKSTDHELIFKFGIVYDDLGIIKFDLYLSDDSNLGFSELSLMTDEYFDLEALTEDKHRLSGSDILMNSLSSSNNKIKFTCYDKIIFEAISRQEHSEREGIEKSLYFIELEGFNLEFSDITYNNKIRKGENINSFPGFERDHTSALLIYNGLNFGCNHFDTLIYKKNDNGNIIFDFTKCKTPNDLKFSTYLNFKNDFTYFLALMNGANLKIRSEYTGKYYQLDQIYSQEIHIYSFSQVVNARFNDYIPISSPISRGKNIVNHFFINHFDNYIRVNKNLDINSIVFYINSAYQSKTVEERFFILIIALERLANNYMSHLNDTREHVILPKPDFEDLKKKLIAVINECKKEVIKNKLSDEKKEFSNKYDKFASIIGQMNFTNKSVNHKFKELLKFAEIDLNEDIKYILEKLRHTSIHKGEIEEGMEGYKYTLVLDELIRDVILNLIGYNYIKKSKAYPEKNQGL